MIRNHVKAITKAFEPFRYRHNVWQAWQDFVELAAICMSRADLVQAEARELRYLEVIKRYSPDEVAAFPRIFAELILALEVEPADILGAAFMDMELGNKWAGQFFTPQALCDVMAAVTLDAGMKDTIEQQGFVRMEDPAVGGGALPIAACKAMQAAGFNYQQQLHIVARDVDIKSVHMAYVQLSLLHVPAIVIHGNTLSNEVRSVWYTPAHIIGGWSFKLRRSETTEVKKPIQLGQMDLFGAAA